MIAKVEQTDADFERHSLIVGGIVVATQGEPCHDNSSIDRCSSPTWTRQLLEQAAAEINATMFDPIFAPLWIAIQPVKDWYQSDEQPPRPLVDILTDVVADLQVDRAEAIELRNAFRFVIEELKTLGFDVKKLSDAIDGRIKPRGIGAVTNAALQETKLPSEITQRQIDILIARLKGNNVEAAIDDVVDLLRMLQGREIKFSTDLDADEFTRQSAAQSSATMAEATIEYGKKWVEGDESMKQSSVRPLDVVCLKCGDTGTIEIRREGYGVTDVIFCDCKAKQKPPELCESWSDRNTQCIWAKDHPRPHQDHNGYSWH